MIWKVFLCAIVLAVNVPTPDAIKYSPTWDSIDSRPIPSWFDEAKFGIMIHWGVFSVPSFGHEWFWWNWHQKEKAYVDFIKKNYPPNWTYANFAKSFRAEFYDPDKWAEIFQASGAKYIVPTTKHHEGFSMWNTTVSFNWNAVEVGPNMNLMAMLERSIRKKTDIHFGIYHSLYEWFNPMYLQDQRNGYKTNNFIKYKVTPSLHELVNYLKPDLIWSDGDWDSTPEYWNSTHFLAWLYNESPIKDKVVVNDRWGAGTGCKHGGYWNCHDRYNAKKLVQHKWEMVDFVDKVCCVYRRDAYLKDLQTTHDIIRQLVEVVSCNGNYLLNVGATADGRIVQIFEEKLREIGSWLKVNGEAIYKTRPWVAQNDTHTAGLWYTSKKEAGGTSVYAISLSWPHNGILQLGSVKQEYVTQSTTIHMVGHDQPLKFAYKGGLLEIYVPPIAENEMPCKWAWSFKMKGLNF